MAEDNITVPRYVFEGLMSESRLLNALHAAGLDEDTYNRAIEILDEEGGSVDG